MTGKPTAAAIAAAAPDRASAARLLPGVVLAGAGTFIAIAVLGGLAAFSRQPLVPGSFGASCVLLFGFPAGPFSQPRNLVGGHLLTKTVGLVFLTLFGPGWLAMAGAAALLVIAWLIWRAKKPGTWPLRWW